MDVRAAFDRADGVRIIKALNPEPAFPAEVRDMLGLPQLANATA